MFSINVLQKFRFDKETRWTFLRYVFLLTMTQILCGIVVGVVLSLLKGANVQIPVSKANLSLLFNMYGKYTFLIVALLGPIREELMFRLPLRLTKLNINITLIAFLAFFLTRFHYNIEIFFAIFIVGLTLILVLNIKIQKFKIRTFQENNLNALKWISIIGFTLMHFFNYEITNISDLIIVCISISPIFFLSYYLTTVRIDLGLGFSIILHCLNNSFALFLYLTNTHV